MREPYIDPNPTGIMRRPPTPDEVLEGAGIVLADHSDLDRLTIQIPRPPEDAPIRVLIWYLVRRWCRRTFGGRKARRIHGLTNGETSLGNTDLARLDAKAAEQRHRIAALRASRPREEVWQREGEPWTFGVAPGSGQSSRAGWAHVAAARRAAREARGEGATAQQRPRPTKRLVDLVNDATREGQPPPPEPSRRLD